MKTCPLCEKIYPSQHTTCPADGALLIDSRELEPGTLIRGKYRIVRQLGRGGMGTVYLAEHILLGRQRALKFISSELSRDAAFLRRFRREAQAAIELRHPNIVEVVDLDQAEDGSPYIAMEYVDGPDLRHALAAGPFAIERALAIARGIAQGLGAAHAKGIIHRDVKPENVLLAGGKGSPEVPKLLDFGIAAMKETATAVSRTHGLMLTPPYAAPEQWKGMAAEELDGRTDLYALGGVLYEMLTGQTPFHAHNMEGWMYQHLHEQPKPPSTLRPELANWPGLDALVLRLLAKDREQRFPSAADLLEKLALAPSEARAATVAQPSPAPRIPTVVEPPPPPVPPPAPIPLESEPVVSEPVIPEPSLAPKPVDSEPSPVPVPSRKLPIKWLAAAALLIIAVAGVWFATGPSTWTDPATGLMWAKKDNGKDVNWQQATDYCRNLQLAGNSDWRLPTIDELQGIYDPSGNIYGEPVKGNLRLSGWVEWSSSTGGTSAWDFIFSTGARSSTYLDYSSYFRARCVRGSASKGPAPAVNPAQVAPPPELKPELLGHPTPPSQNANIAGVESQAMALYKQKQYAQASPLFDQACIAGNHEACDHVSFMYSNGLGLTRGDSKESDLYTKACDSGSAPACEVLGDLYRMGHGGVKEDYSRAVALYTKSCDGNYGDGCWTLGAMYFNGEGTTRDVQRAASTFLKACTLGSSLGCLSTGRAYRDGYGFAQDPEKAKQFLKKGCSMGNRMGCDELKKMP